MANGPNPPSDQITGNAAVIERARLVQQVVSGLVPGKPQMRFNIADAVVSDALGLPGRGERAFRLEQGLQALDTEALAALLPRVEGMLALARAYAANRRG